MLSGTRDLKFTSEKALKGSERYCAVNLRLSFGGKYSIQLSYGCSLQSLHGKAGEVAIVTKRRSLGYCNFSRSRGREAVDSPSPRSYERGYEDFSCKSTP